MDEKCSLLGKNVPVRTKTHFHIVWNAFPCFEQEKSWGRGGWRFLHLDFELDIAKNAISLIYQGCE